MNNESLKLSVHEIYNSVQGESSYAGIRCTFVRLSECPLRCRWCDTAAAFKKGEDFSIQEIIDQIKELPAETIELTGGEPLAQKESYELLRQLVQTFPNRKILIETSGSEPIQDVDQNVHIVMDIKCPGSRMEDKNLWTNLDHIKETDEIKFVIADKNDFEWAQNIIAKHSLNLKAKLLFSPAFGLLKPDLLVEWMLEEQIPARLNLQLHKYIWSPRKQGV